MTQPETATEIDFVSQLDDYLRSSGVEYEFLMPGKPMPTVPLAAAAIGADEAQILKTLLFEGKDGNVVLVVASGPLPVDPAKLAAASGLDQPRLARAARVLQLTGFPAGGVPPVGHTTRIRTLIDDRVMELAVAYGGGGHEDVLLQIRPADILKLTNGEIVSVTSLPPR
jgi:prolyl-tRNA editing enzyme YbaK/EbsC (Cys-tRNA(Pro) deacylase)